MADASRLERPAARRLGSTLLHIQRQQSKQPASQLLAASTCDSSKVACRPASRQKNLLVILTDDQGYWTLGRAGNTECATPNLDRLAASGIWFSNFFCVSPVCSPARASMLTGRIPSQHGIHDWLRGGNTPSETDDGRLDEYLAGQTGYTDVLAQHGYVCGLSGKVSSRIHARVLRVLASYASVWPAPPCLAALVRCNAHGELTYMIYLLQWHMGHSHKPQKGFSFWRPHTKGGGPYYAAPMVDTSAIPGAAQYTESRYITDVFTDTAIEFLTGRLALSASRTASGARPACGATSGGGAATAVSPPPWCLYVAYTAPHSPWGREHHPRELWDKYHDACALASAPPWGLPPPPWVLKRNIPVDTPAQRRRNLAGCECTAPPLPEGRR